MLCVFFIQFVFRYSYFSSQIPCGLGDLKECDGTHSERSARRVPTLRNQRKHRTKQRHLWDICGLSVAFYKHVSIIMLQKSSARKWFCAESVLKVWLNYNRFILSKRKSSILMYCTPLLSVHGRISSRTTTILVYESSIRVSELISCCRFSSSAIVNAD